MARTALSSTHEHAATLRQLKLLVIVLVLSNIGLGAFSFYLLRRLDRQYSDLIERSVPALSDLQTLTVRAVAVMRATNPGLTPIASERRAAFGQQGRRAVAQDQELRRKLLAGNLAMVSEEERGEMLTAGEAFSKVALEVVSAYSAGRGEEAAQVRDTVLRPAFDRYLAAATKASDTLETSSLEANQAMSESAGSLATVVLGIASWPIVVLVGILLLTAVFVLVLMVLFRGREMSDMP